MKVVFFDKLRETYLSVENVIQVDSLFSKVNGRLTSVWFLTMADEKPKTFKQKDFTIFRVCN